MTKPDIFQRTMIDVLTPNVKSAVLKQYIADTFSKAGCTHEHGYENEFLDHYPMERLSITGGDNKIKGIVLVWSR